MFGISFFYLPVSKIQHHTPQALTLLKMLGQRNRLPFKIKNNNLMIQVIVVVLSKHGTYTLTSFLSF